MGTVPPDPPIQPHDASGQLEAGWSRLAGAVLFAVALVGSVALVGTVGGAWESWDGPQRPLPTPGTGGTVSSPPPSAPRACEQDALIGQLKADDTPAYRRPWESSRVVAVFDTRSVLGAPQVFLLEDDVYDQGGRRWFRALLPVRPNGTTGYIQADRLELARTPWRLELTRRRFELRLYRNCELVRRFRVGIGTGDTPTPTGRFYLASLLKVPDPDTIYGPYAYGLSGFSETLEDWPFGGIVGLHGTNDPSSIGRRSSHGCIRMRNRDILQLVKILPLGTPMEID
ncbi:MAG TPA: L,D-transpeptidase [Actinomycetota bacterium]|nr:L,D-transpeptidase [Actinomycetota bacterium]